MDFKLMFRALAVGLLLVSLVGWNLAVLYSSVPHYQQMGWAIFCGMNATWIMVVGILTLCYAESHEVAMRQLNWDHEREPA